MSRLNVVWLRTFRHPISVHIYPVILTLSIIFQMIISQNLLTGGFLIDGSHRVCHLRNDRFSIVVDAFIQGCPDLMYFG